MFWSGYIPVDDAGVNKLSFIISLTSISKSKVLIKVYYLKVLQIMLYTFQLSATWRQ